MGLSIYGRGVGVMVGTAVSVGMVVGVALGMVVGVALGMIFVAVEIAVDVAVAVGVLSASFPPVHAHRSRILIVQRSSADFFIFISPG